MESFNSSKFTDFVENATEKLWSKIESGIDRIKNNNSPRLASGESDTEASPCADHCEEIPESSLNPKSLRYWRLADSDMKVHFVKALLYGLKTIPRRGTPGVLTETGSDTFHVSVTSKGDSIQSAGLYGSGRVVVFAHNGYTADLSTEPSNELEHSTNRFVLNSVLWATSSECQLGAEGCSPSVCDRNVDVTSYPLNWGADCQQPIKIGGLGFDDRKFTQVFDSLKRTAGDGAEILVKGEVRRLNTDENVQAVIESRPDVIIWTNNDVSYEKVNVDESGTYLDSRAENLLRYVHQGGGVVLSLCPWGWESLANVSVSDTSVYSSFVNKIGIHLTSDVASGSIVSVEKAVETAQNDPASYEKVSKCVDSLSTSANIDLPELKSLISTYLSCPASAFLPDAIPQRGWLPESGKKFQVLLSRLETIALTLGQHSLSFPIKFGNEQTTVTQSIAASLVYLVWLRRRGETIQPSLLHTVTPTVETFPGVVGQGKRNEGIIFSMVASNKRWQTVPIYAPPGEVITITISDQTLQEFPSLTLKVQIGAHTDKLALIDNDYKLQRHPRICQSRIWTPRRVGGVDNHCAAKHATYSNGIEIGSVYGGVIYITAERGALGGTNPLLVFSIKGGVPIPHYSHVKEIGGLPLSFNESSDSYPYWSSTWEQRVTQFVDAPWTDIEGRYIIFTLPVSVLQDFSNNDIKEFLAFWDQVVYHEHDLAGDLHELEFTQERLTCDEQISAGYMHSGYPVMCFTDIITTKPESGSRAPLINLKELEKKPFWGVYHELGHNRQKDSWTWEDMTEVTVNIFSLYSCFKMNHMKPYETSWLQEQIKIQLEYLKDDAKSYDPDFSQDAGVAIGAYAVYVQFIADWQIIKNIFQTYKDKKLEPSSDNDKINEWIKQTSLAIDTDLRPYYKQWKWPINDQYLADIDGLTPWSGNVVELIEQSQQS